MIANRPAAVAAAFLNSCRPMSSGESFCGRYARSRQPSAARKARAEELGEQPTG